MAKGYSLHLGLNSVDSQKYDGWDGQLNACENDAKDMAAIAKSQKFSQSKLLLTKQAKSAALIDAMLDLARTMADGDFLLLTYSGHGGQVRDETGEEEDGMDETWCLYDRQLIDDELYRLFGQFKSGVRILMLSDSCHSGTMARMRRDAKLADAGHISREVARSEGGSAAKTEVAANTPIRLAPLEVTMANYAANRDMYRAIKAAAAGAEATAPAAQVILISGCMDDQTSLDGVNNGLFTGTLKRIWRNGKFKGGYRLFHQTIVSRMPPTQVPNLFKVGKVSATFMNQKPFSV